MSVSPYALTDLVSAKRALGFPQPTVADATQDPIIEGLIDACTARIEASTDRLLMQRTGLVTKKHGTGRREILLPQWPVQAISSVVLDGETLDASQYEMVRDHNGVGIGLERLDGVWTRGRFNLVVTFNAGYTAKPADLQLACNFFVQFYKRRLEDKDLGLQVRNKGDENITIVNSMPALIAEILSLYKRSEFMMDELVP